MTTVIRDDRSTKAGGRMSARQSFVVAALVVASLVCVVGASGQTVPVTVQGDRGVYRVTATFATPQPAAIGHAVLTDYEQIPRFLPDVLSSHVVARDAECTVVAQEALAKVLFFSKRVRLVLEIRETPARIAFRDRGGESFIRYEGQWTLRDDNGGTLIGYELVAQPRFDVPDFILTRLLKRDAERMIARLKAEIAARAVGAASLQSRR
jgi:carbon monoxide dehydrogenase subunit G